MCFDPGYLSRSISPAADTIMQHESNWKAREVKQGGKIAGSHPGGVDYAYET